MWYFTIRHKVFPAVGYDDLAPFENGNGFHRVVDAATATDFIVFLYSDVDLLHENQSLIEHLRKIYGIDDEYIATIYCLLRGIDYDIKGGQYCAYASASSDSRNIVTGHGSTVLMAIANLYYEMSIFCKKTFVP